MTRITTQARVSEQDHAIAPPNGGSPAPRATRRLGRFGPVLAGVLCALACAVPAFGAALAGGATANLLGVPAWIAAVVIAAAVAVFVIWRARGTSGEQCGC